MDERGSASSRCAGVVVHGEASEKRERLSRLSRNVRFLAK
jgi:hypothetical protein